MQSYHALVLLCLALTCTACLAAPATAPADDSPLFDIPRLSGIAIDGRGDDWAQGGFAVEAMVDSAAKPRRAEDFDSRFRLGWDERGLLMLLNVRDRAPVEAVKDADLFRNDSIELFVSTGRGATDRYQVVLAPGRTAHHPELRYKLVELRKTASLTKTPLAVTAARSATESGYVMEVLLPWANLGIAPEAGREIALQIVINDTDYQSGRYQTMWYPRGGAYSDTKAMHRLRLAESASAPVRAATAAAYERFRRTRVTVVASADLTGKGMEVRESERSLGTASLATDGDRAGATLALPMPPRGKAYGPLSVLLDGQLVRAIELANPDEARRDAIAYASFLFRPCVFSGDAFPAGEFENPSLVEDLVGPYTLSTTFYDADFNVVTSATKPGRYGAIVQIRTEDGQAFKRFCTLYRQPKEADWREMKMSITATLPEAFGINPAVLSEQSGEVSDFFQSLMRDAFYTSGAPAIVMAGLSQVSPGTGKLLDRNGPFERDRQWWYQLKKKTGDFVPLQYLVHLPPGYSAESSQRWPLILFLHGSGERGDNLQRVKVNGIPKLVETRKDLPFIVISPQCPAREWWLSASLNDLLDEVSAKYHVDADRIYLTGLSMGGFGSWSMAAQYPQRFAAVAPICGGGDPDDVAILKDLPIWVFHGGQDPTVPIKRSQEMVDALTKVSGRVRFTVFPEAGHDSWTAAYNTQELYTWLLQQRRGQPQQPATQPAR